MADLKQTDVTAVPRFADVATLTRSRLRDIPIVGADVVEVSPPLDPSGGTALVAANLMFEILCLLAEYHSTPSD